MYVCTSFFFKDTPTTEIYTLSLHDALPIFDHVTRETGATTDNTYDALNRLQSVTHKNAIDAVMASYAYTRDSDGRITDVQESDISGLTGTSHYDYDELGRLTLENYNGAAAGTDYTTSYTLDIVGNRLAKSTTFEDGHVEEIASQFDARDRLLHEDTRFN